MTDEYSIFFLFIVINVIHKSIYSFNLKKNKTNIFDSLLKKKNIELDETKCFHFSNLVIFYSSFLTFQTAQQALEDKSLWKKYRPHSFQKQKP